MSFKSCTNALRAITNMPETNTSNTIDTQEDLTDHVDSTKQIQTILNDIFDESWTITDSEQHIELQEVVEKIPKSALLSWAEANEQKTNYGLTQINDLEKKVNNASISKSHLLLGSIGVEILVKMACYLTRHELLRISACRSFNDINNLDNVDSLKSLLEANNFKWEEIRLTIKILKHNRLSIAHPNDKNTAKEDVMKAIECCYLQASSS